MTGNDQNTNSIGQSPGANDTALSAALEMKEFPGARWWKVDFHAHTPASEDYGKGPQQADLQNLSPEDWLLAHMRAEIDCVAITDHNTGEWIDKLKGALDGLRSHDEYRPIVLFPGVELSVNGGLHFLAIFDPEKATDDITRLLGAVGFNDTQGRSDGVTNKSVIEVIGLINDAGGLVIPAHVDHEAGLFTVLRGESLRQVLDSPHIIAMELFDRGFRKPQLYTERKVSWTDVLGSDSHHPKSSTGSSSADAYPGSLYTWVKMGRPDLEGLRLALIDGEQLSIRRSDKTASDPNVHTDHMIESIEIKDARYCGHPKPLLAKLSPWLNTVIGGRGTGKSTIVEFLRIGMRREDELPDELGETFENFRRVPANRYDPGALTETTQVRVVYRSPTGRYRLQWEKSGKLPSIEEQQSDGSWREAPGDIRQRFPVRIFSQKQVYALAQESKGLLKVVDEAPKVDHREWDAQWRQEETRYLSLRGKARELEAQLTEENRLKGDLDDVNGKLKLFEEAEHARVLKDYQLRQRQDRAMRQFGEGLTDGETQIAKLLEAVQPPELDDSLFNPEDPGDKGVLDRAAGVAEALASIRSDLQKVTGKFTQIRDDWEGLFQESPWQAAFSKADAAYKKLVAELQGQGAGDPSQYGPLVQKRQILEQRVEALDDIKKSLADIRKQGDDSLDRLARLRRDLSERRAKFLYNALQENPHVRIKLDPYGSRQLREVEAQFRTLIGREDTAFEDDILSGDERRGLLANLYANLPEDRETAAAKIEERLSSIKKDLRACATGNSGDRFGKRFQNYIGTLPPEAMDRIQIWYPKDSLVVSYGTEGGGSRFRLIQQASPGQKTAAILTFLMAYGDEPMVIDQPEDDLDNHLIYDLIVRQLRERKRKRQLLVVTHNANIVVNGDAELVLAMDQPAGQCKIVCQGSLQERSVREEVCRVMEGGLEAFEQRYRRIARGVGHA